MNDESAHTTDMFGQDLSDDLTVQRDVQAGFYFILEIAKAIIYSILLYIVTNYSIKRFEIVQRDTMIAEQGKYHEINADIVKMLN